MNSSTPTINSRLNDRASLLARIAALELENRLLREAFAKPTIPSFDADAQDAAEDLNVKNNGIYFDGIRSRLNTAEDCAAKMAAGGSSTPLEAQDQSNEEAGGFGSRPNIFSRSRSADVYSGACGSQVYFPLGEKKINRFASLQAIDVDSDECDFFPAKLDLDQEDEIKKDISRSMPVMDISFSSDEMEASREKRRLSEHKMRQHTHTASRAIDLFMSLNSLNKMLSQETMRSFDDSSETRQSFQQFFLFSVDPNIVRKNSDWDLSSGSAFLDPIVMRCADCIDHYPRGIRSGMSTDDLSMFCLLEGLKIWLIPRAACSGDVARLKNRHDYKVLAFTDINGMTNHGVAITVLEEVDTTISGYKGFVKEAQTQQHRRLAARKIARWWRLSLHKKVNVETPTIKGLNDSVQSYEAKKEVKSSFGPKLKKMLGLVGDSDRLRSSRQRKEQQELPKSLKQKRSSDVSQSSAQANRRGKESSDRMKNASTSWVTCLVEKCFVMIGGKQSEQFLQFRSLRHLIEMESEGCHDEAVRCMNSDNNQKDYTIVNQETLRHKFLSVVKTRMCLNPIQARVTHPENAFDIIATYESMPTFDINLPAFNWVDRMSIHLPLPQVARHWGLSVLFERIRPSCLLATLRLLLIERSVLIIGESSIVASSCACALVDLLRPYKWASTFMPLLPQNMLDFVHSPVPFITGVVVKDRSNANRVEKDHRVVEALSNGLSIVNLISGSVLITKEPGIKTMIEQCPAETTKLSLYRARLKSLRGASSDSFAAFIDSGVSTKEIVTLSAVQRVVFDYMKFFAGDIGSTPDGWQRYGIHLGGEDDSDIGDFAFYPSLFVKPLREQMQAQLQLQQMMAHSQLFVEYVSGKRRNWKSRQHMARGEIGQFIARWIFERWRQRKRWHSSCQMCSPYPYVQPSIASC